MFSILLFCAVSVICTYIDMYVLPSSVEIENVKSYHLHGPGSQKSPTFRAFIIRWMAWNMRTIGLIKDLSDQVIYLGELTFNRSAKYD